MKSKLSIEGTHSCCDTKLQQLFLLVLFGATNSSSRFLII